MDGAGCAAPRGLDALRAARRGIAVSGSLKEGFDGLVVGGFLDVVPRHIVHSVAFVLFVEDDDIAVGHVPGFPGRIAGLVRQERQVAKTSHLGEAVFIARLIDGQDLDRGATAVFEVFLKSIQGAELAPAVASRRMGEVPAGHLLQVVSRRDVLCGGRRGLIDVYQ